jgi:two-component system, cell cycle response regulator
MNSQGQRKPVKVLIADDDPVSRRLLQLSLSPADYEVVIATDGAEALRKLQGKDCPRLAILDWMMPEVDGVEVCRAVRQRPGESYVYIILLTAKTHPTEIIEGLEAGADDYIIKPFDIHELKARLRAGRRILELQEQLVSAGERLRVQATHDSLTGLLNRMAILETLEKELARSARQKNPVAVIMADIDQFKVINDTYGHLVGDAVLQEVSARVLKTVRAYDAVGRYGGEEFLIVSPGCNLEEAPKQAERIRANICAQPICLPEGPVSVTMSFGVAITSTDILELEPSDLLRLADESLYAAKKGGRNKVEVSFPVPR